MKVAFFAAALIGIANAVSFENILADEDYNLAQVDDEFDFEDYDLAQLDDFDEDDFAEIEDSDMEDYDLAEIDNEDYEDYNFAQIDSDIDSDEEAANAMKVRLNTPECKEEKKVPFESAVMGALQELGSKSNDLATALQTQFEKNRQLKAGQIMNVSGQLIVRPKSEDLEVAVPKKEEEKKADPVTVKVDGGKVEEKK